MESVLVIDDEPGIRTAIKEVLSRDDLQVHTAENQETGLRQFIETNPTVVLLDIRLGSDSGLETFTSIRRLDPRAIVIFITGHGTTELAIESMKMGAFDYLVKPLDKDHLKEVVEQGIRIGRTMRVPSTVTYAESLTDDSDRIVGSSHQIQMICKSIGRIAPQNVNVLIVGESGTGKELIARAIYDHSRRSRATYLAINCAAIPENLLESELFGHEQGAFTGADRRRIGKFEQCHQGTIFLDEIGDMPLLVQAKMLRLLQEGEFQRVGGNETIRTDVRIIAATNQNLEAMIDQGKFRRDLYYRLRGVTIQLPPLRERADDIPELAHYFLFRFNQQLGTRVESISENAIEKLIEYHWPGNVRELQSVIREAMIGSVGPTLLEEFLPQLPARPVAEPTPPTETIDELKRMTCSWESFGNSIDRILNENHASRYREAYLLFDQILIQRALDSVQGNQSKAADLLGISRPTLRAKIRELQSRLQPRQEGE